MIFKIKLVSDEVNNFYRIYEIDSESKFIDFRNLILDSVGYSHDCIDSFAICNDEWEPTDNIVLEDIGIQSSDRDVFLMDSTTLSEFIEDEGQKLVFIFDNLNERAFFMEVKEILIGKTLESPICTSRQGKAPSQEMDDLLSVKMDTSKSSSDMFDDLDFGDNEGYDDDDLAGFDEMDESKL